MGRGPSAALCNIMGGEEPPIRTEATPDPIKKYEQAFEVVVTRLNAPPVTHLCVGSDTVASLKRAIEFATRVPVQSQVLAYTPTAPLGTKPPKLLVWPARRHPVEGTKARDRSRLQTTRHTNTHHALTPRCLVSCVVVAVLGGAHVSCGWQ